MINSDGQRANCGTPVAVLATENACTSFGNRVEAVSSSAPDLSHMRFPAVPMTSLRISMLTDVTHPGLPNESSWLIRGRIRPELPFREVHTASCSPPLVSLRDSHQSLHAALHFRCVDAEIAGIES